MQDAWRAHTFQLRCGSRVWASGPQLIRTACRDAQMQTSCDTQVALLRGAGFPPQSGLP